MLTYAQILYKSCYKQLRKVLNIQTLKFRDYLNAEEGGHTLHAAKNNFSETSVSKVLLALL